MCKGRLSRENWIFQVLFRNNILDFSKIEAGKLELDREEFNLYEVVGHAVKLLSHRAHQKKLELACRISPDVPQRAVGDAMRLRQILINLLGNAVKFTDRGEIVLAVSTESSSDRDLTLHFSISDTGIGIPPEKQRAVFEAFAQADMTSSRRFEGTGLGLAICRSLVQLMDGRIWVESASGKGSVFHFTARFGLAGEKRELLPGPIENLSVLAAEPLSDPAPAPSRKLHVLVGEDNPMNQKLVSELLKKRGHTFVLADDGHAVLAEYQSKSFDVILMDIQMPGLDGIQATAAIREIERQTGRHTPIIAQTAHAIKGNRERCLAAGMDEYVSKPIDPRQLLELV